MRSLELMPPLPHEGGTLFTVFSCPTRERRNMMKGLTQEKGVLRG